MHVQPLVNALATGAFKKEKNVVQNTRKPGRQEQQVSTQTMKQSWSPRYTTRLITLHHSLVMNMDLFIAPPILVSF